MKLYMNKKERENFCVISLVAGIIDDILRDSTDISKEEHRDLKTAQTWIYKFMDSIIKRKEKDTVEQILRDIKTSEIMVLPKLQAQLEWERRKEKLGYIHVNRDTLLDMAENALIGCENCTKKDYKECSLRKCFMELEIEPYDLNAEGCQYKVVKVKKEVS